jgi:hypothetical protein
VPHQRPNQKRGFSRRGTRPEKTLSSRPEPERQRRRSGGTCCSVPRHGNRRKSRAGRNRGIPPFAKSAKDGAPRPARVERAPPPAAVDLDSAGRPYGTPHEYRGRAALQRRVKGFCRNPASPLRHTRKKTLSSRPEPERQRRRSGGTCCSIAYTNGKPRPGRPGRARVHSWRLDT